MVDDIHLPMSFPEDISNVIPFDPSLNENDFNPEIAFIPDFQSPDLSHMDKPPALDEIETAVGFEVEIPGESSGKTSWVYSGKFRKIYIKMNSPFTVNIKYKNYISINQQPSNLKLRIIPVFYEPEDHHMPVNRCKHHHNDILPHILACKNQNAQHVGHPDEINYGTRLCSVVPMTSTSSDVKENITLEFYCQNSCVSGINRRTTALIFALEKENNEIIGKRLLYFKVCSCPKRDMNKEEEALNEGAVQLKRRADDQLTPGRGKRPCKILVKKEVKQEFPTPDTSPYSPQNSIPMLTHVETMPPQNINPGVVMPQFIMPNYELALEVLQTAIEKIANLSKDAKNSTYEQQLDIYRENIKQLKQEMQRQQLQQQIQQLPERMQFDQGQSMHIIGMPNMSNMENMQ
uniref:CSON013041 protein n=1 Tax=Culicoides sonorensis TaxID=179676 RepID=A0A336M6V4_CULSO